MNGKNVALLPDGVTPVSINNVNGGRPYGRYAKNPEYYRNNDRSDGGGGINTEMDGLTTVLTVNAAVKPGVLNHIKLAIADAGDDALDSNVLIKAGSFSANHPPTVTPPADQTGMLGTPTVYDVGTFADPDQNENWTASIDWGDGSVETFPLGATGPIGRLSHTYTAGGVMKVAVTVTDKAGAFDTKSFLIEFPANVPPTATFNAPLEVNEGEIFSISLTLPVDEEIATLTYAFDCGNGWKPLTADNSLTCAIPDDASVTVGGMVMDNGGLYTKYFQNVLVKNVAPTVGAPGVLDTHTAEWSFNGISAPGTAADGIASVNDAFATPGIYSIAVKVTDDDGGVGTAFATEYIVVYDPNGGYVTGSGWIDSPAGAYSKEPSLTGRANFGFVSKYLKGATVPTGQTEFQFKAGSLNFHSSAYEWLVVGGTRAQFKGTGTINGAGTYKFMLTAVDDPAGDGFRIKITDDAGNVVYDNQMGKAETGSDATLISGGNIVIHK